MTATITCSHRPPGLLSVWLPYAGDNKSWLRDGMKLRIKKDLVWRPIERQWNITYTRARYLRLVRLVTSRYGTVTVHVEASTQQVCSASCKSARGDVCDFVCGGAYHGAGGGLEWVAVGAGDALVKHEWIWQTHIVTGEIRPL